MTDKDPVIRRTAIPPATAEPTFAAAGGQLSSHLFDETIILDLSSGLYYGLDDVGTLLWRRMQKPATLSELCEAVADDYRIDAARCRDDVDELLCQLTAAGLVEAEAAPATHPVPEPV